MDSLWVNCMVWNQPISFCWSCIFCYCLESVTNQKLLTYSNTSQLYSKSETLIFFLYDLTYSPENGNVWIYIYVTCTWHYKWVKSRALTVTIEWQISVSNKNHSERVSGAKIDICLSHDPSKKPLKFLFEVLSVMIC